MAHTTTCPSCNTTFRVTAEQLLARNGNVRCGRCAHVFNAHLSLSLDYPQPESGMPAEETPAAAEMPAAQEFVAAAETPVETAPHPEQTSAPEFLAVDLEAESESAPEAQPDSPVGAASAPEAPPLAEPVPENEPPPAAPEEVELPQAEETPSVETAPRRRNFRLLWLAGIALLALALLLQNILHFRNELIAQSPGLKPIFEQACSVLGCRVALPQNADLLSIEASSLEAGAGHPGIVVLSAALRNRAGYTQAYPLFELTLTDYQDKLVARRVFQPQEYLPPAAAAQAGMPAHEEIEVKLNIDLGDAKAAGYRVYLFYPSTAS